MLVRLLPDDISSKWKVIREALLRSLPSYVDNDDNAFNKLLFALLDETLHCWLIVEYEDKQPMIHAVATTTIAMDSASGTKNLLIYSIAAFRTLSPELLKDAMESIQNFARSLKCSKIIAFTDVKKIVDMAKLLGANTAQTLIEMEVK